MEDYKECSSDDSSDDCIFEDDYYIHEEIFHLKDNKELISKYDVLEKASRFIFAEDLVSYISLKFHGFVYATKINRGSKSPILFYRFNESVRNAVQYIRSKIITAESSSLEITEKLIKSCKFHYRNFADAILSHYSEKGLTSAEFLYFCVYFAELAAKCCTLDFEETLDHAIYAILDAFCMFKEGTYELNKFTNAVVYKLKDFPCCPKCDISERTLPEALVEDTRDNYSKDKVLVKAFSVLESHLVESLSALELSMADKSNRLEMLRTIQSKISRELDKYMEKDINEVFSLMLGYSEPTHEVNSTECHKNESSAEKYESFVQEFMMIVKSEASLFSELYLSHKSHQKTDSQNEECNEGEEENSKVIEFLNLPTIEIKEELISQICFINKSEIFVQQETERKCDNSNDFLNYKEVQFRESQVLEDQLSKKPEDNNEDTVNQPKCESRNAASELCSDHTIAVPDDCTLQKIIGLLAAYKREGEFSNRNVITLKGDSVLFAEDLIRYISYTFYGIPCSQSKFEEYRNILCNHFNESVKEIAHFFHDASKAVNETVFDLIKTVKIRRTDCYRRYVAAVLSRYSRDGLDSGAFLYYCFHFSELASKLYRFKLPEILDFAVYSILDAFCCLKDDWDELNLTVEHVLNCFKTKNYKLYENLHYVDMFEKDCVDTIVGSLKEISRFRTELELLSITENASDERCLKKLKIKQ